jgi:hypothetical protein
MSPLHKRRIQVAVDAAAAKNKAENATKAEKEGKESKKSKKEAKK